jgi:hypothetical protein
MWKKGDSRHSWTRRYFEVKQQIVYYFAEPTDEKPLGVIPLDGCQIKVPPENAQFFENHSDNAIKDCYEFWISHPHRRLFSICAKSREERQNWLVSLMKRTKKGYAMGSGGAPIPQPSEGLSGLPPPGGLQGADEVRECEEQSEEQSDKLTAMAFETICEIYRCPHLLYPPSFAPQP